VKIGQSENPVRYLFNPSLLGFLVIFALANLAACAFYVVGYASLTQLGRISQFCAVGFLFALAYTAFLEPPRR
jgi:hypothetical protein